MGSSRAASIRLLICITRSGSERAPRTPPPAGTAGSRAGSAD
jgi:hypothetical protein